MAQDWQAGLNAPLKTQRLLGEVLLAPGGGGSTLQTGVSSYLSCIEIISCV